jgi:hypothetical protein
MCIDPFSDVPVAVVAVESSETADQRNSHASGAWGLANSDAATRREQLDDRHGGIEGSEDGDDDAPPSLVDSASDEDQGADSEGDSDGSLGRLASIRRNLREVVNTTKHKLTRTGDVRRCKTCRRGKTRNTNIKREVSNAPLNGSVNLSWTIFS